MDWKLIFLLSGFGLAMGVATVFVIPANIEPVCWLAILPVCAYLIARQCSGRHFLHGVFVAILNSVWITAAHILLFDQYMASHPQEAGMMRSMPVQPKLLMVFLAPFFGATFGLILGLCAVLAAKFVKPALHAQPQ